MSAKLDNLKSVPKTYWTILNKFLYNKKYIICTPIKSGSKLLSFCYKTEKRITPFDIKDDDILLIITNLNMNKAHGWDHFHDLQLFLISLCLKS